LTDSKEKLQSFIDNLVNLGHVEYVPELEEYVYVGSTIKLQKEVQGGFVKIVDGMGNDATVVNSARVSFGNMIHEIKEKDLKLIDYLAKNNHTSPFRHCYVQFHIKAPEFVARQWYKHVVGSEYSFKDQPWNEISGRYVKLDHEFWEPEKFRIQSESNKQASVAGSQVDDNEGAVKIYKDQIASMFDAYEKLLAAGVAKEQARAILPLSFMTEWYWTASLQTIAHFVNLRDHSHAQIEIRDFAVEIDQMMYTILPNTWKALRNKSE
jgi:thymidylate synthase (FAD)